MKKILALTAASLCSSPVLAGAYVNLETNASYTGSDYKSRSTDYHIGYQNTLGVLDWYAQGGRTVDSFDNDLWLEADSESTWSGKVGGSVSATEKLDVYGEVSFANFFDEDIDNSYGTKLGAKFAF